MNNRISNIHPGHFVAIFGGGVAGSEAAFQLSKRGIYSVLFEQNELPYGKIEEGLPKWHFKLRDQEEQKIDAKLTQPGIFFIPNAKLGLDLHLEDVLNSGFSAVLLAVGAWHDRPLPIPGIDRYIGKGLYYQNPFVSWFNHNHDPNYKGSTCEVADDAIVIGGGLASLDVVKILMLTSTLDALKKRGHKADLFMLEKAGIPQVLDELGLTWQELGLKGCTLYYRRKAAEMPVAPMPPDATPERNAKVQLLRERILRIHQEKYLFKIEESHAPVNTIVENGRLAGLVFQRTKAMDGNLQLLSGTEHEVKSPLIVSSIGSTPEPLPNLSSHGELLPIEDSEIGQIRGFKNVFALGNAVTGRGNIKESLLHSRQVSKRVMDDYLGWSPESYEQIIHQSEAESEQRIEKIMVQLDSQPVLTTGEIGQLIETVRQWQERKGYDGDYSKWVKNKLPLRLENLLQKTGTAS